MHLGVRGDQADRMSLIEEDDNDRELLGALFTGGPSNQHPADRCSFMEALPCTKTCRP